MATIPDYTAVGVDLPTPAYRRPIPDQSGEILAGSLGNFAQALQQKQRADAATSASNALSEFRVQTAAALQSAKDNAPDDARGFTPGVLADFDKRSGALLSSADSNPLARQFMQPALTQLRGQVADHAMQWEANQAVAYRSQSVIDNTNKLAPVVESDPTQQQAIGGQLFAQIQASGLPPAERARLNEHVVSQLGAAAGRGLANADPIGMLNRLKDPNDTSLQGLTVEQRDSLEQHAKATLVNQQATALGQVFETNGVQAGTKAMTAFEANPAFPADLRDDVRARVNSDLAQLREERRQQFVGDITKLSGNISTGQAGPADRAAAWSLYNNNVLGPSELAGTLDSIDKVETKRAGDQAALTAAFDAYNNKTPLDPKDSTVKDAVGMLFDQGLTHGVQPGSPEYVNRAVEVASRVGVVPDGPVSWARAHLAAGDPASAAQSAELIARLEEANPRAVGFAVDDKTKAMADSISGAVRAGAPAAVAVDMARRNADLTKADTVELAEKWKAAKADIGQADALTGLLKADPSFKPGIFSGMPAIPAALQGQFDDSTKRYFDLTGGNLTQARELAARDVRRVWGVSEVNGQRQIMPYAPESMFPGLSAQVVREDIAKTVGDNPQAFQHLNPATGALESVAPQADSVRLIPTDHTARTSGMEWQLGAPDQFGAMDILRGANGNPLTYRLPVSSTDFDAVRDRMNDAAIAKARQLRSDRQEAAVLQQEADRESMGTGGPEFWSGR